MDGKALARIVAVVLVAVAVAATALEMSRKEDKPVGEGPHTPAISVPNPLRDDLRRCQTLGEAALRDNGCARLWVEQRDRFLGLEEPSGSSQGDQPASQSTDAVLRARR